jgi:hypothetical protein
MQIVVRTLIVVAGFAGLIATQVGAPPAAPATSIGVGTPIQEVLDELRLASEDPSGFAPRKFRRGIDADRDCLRTRAEVLFQSSQIRATTRGCRVVRGKWVSFYDGQVIRTPRKVKLDRLIPLSEAWESGASTWTKGTRTRFANDARYFTQVPVSAATKRAKSGRSIEQWLPESREDRCSYAVEWIALKHRWRLAVNPSEHAALSGLVRNACANGDMGTRPRAKVVTRA